MSFSAFPGLSYRVRKCFANFQVFIQQKIAPETVLRGIRQVILILDNGTTHAPKQLEHWLQELSLMQDGQLTFHVSSLPPNASWLDQLEIWFRIFQRKHLQPNHFISPSDLEQRIGDFIIYYNQTAKPIKWTTPLKNSNRNSEHICGSLYLATTPVTFCYD